MVLNFSHYYNATEPLSIGKTLGVFVGDTQPLQVGLCACCGIVEDDSKNTAADLEPGDTAMVVERVSNTKLQWAKFYESRKLISLPGGKAFGAMQDRLGPELKTIWLGKGANCHRTMTKEAGPYWQDHPFSVEECPLPRDKDCWQCLYLLTVKELLSRNCVLIAATTNIYERDWVREKGAGSSEIESEVFQREKPQSWGTGTFPDKLLESWRSTYLQQEVGGPAAKSPFSEVEPLLQEPLEKTHDDAKSIVGLGELAGLSRSAPIHPETDEPLGLGCRWERRFLDSLKQEVFVVAKPPHRSKDSTAAKCMTAMGLMHLCTLGCFALTAVYRHRVLWCMSCLLLLAICVWWVFAYCAGENAEDKLNQCCECDAVAKATDLRLSEAYKNRGKGLANVEDSSTRDVTEVEETGVRNPCGC